MEGGWLSDPPGIQQHLPTPRCGLPLGRLASEAGQKEAERRGLSADHSVGHWATAAPLRDSEVLLQQPHPHC